MPRQVPQAAKAKQNTILNSVDRSQKHPLQQSHYGNRQLIAVYQQQLQQGKKSKRTPKQSVNQLLLGQDPPTNRISTGSINSKSPTRQEETEAGNISDTNSHLTDSDDEEMVSTRNTPTEEDSSNKSNKRKLTPSEVQMKKKRLQQQLAALAQSDGSDEEVEDEDDMAEDRKIQSISKGYTCDLTGKNAVVHASELRIQMEKQGLVLNNKVAKKYINDFVAQKGIRKFKFFTHDMASFNSQIARVATATKDPNSYFYNATKERREEWWNQWHETYKTAINAKRSNIQNEVCKNWIGRLHRFYCCTTSLISLTPFLILFIPFNFGSAPQAKGPGPRKAAQDL